MTIQWLTTAPNPDPFVYHGGPDQGQRGWRLHAIEAEDTETFPQIRSRRAACGLRAAHGWDLDLFIERRCSRCVAHLERARAE